MAKKKITKPTSAKKPAKKVAKKPAKSAKLAAKPTPKAAAKTMKVAKPAPMLKGKAAAVKPADVKFAKNVKGQPVAVGKALKGAPAPAPVAATKGKRSAKIDATPICREVACELTATTKTYCRLHYIRNWQRIQRKEQILKEKKLNHYVEELVSKYPDKYIEAIRQDLAKEKDFNKVIADLEIDTDVDEFIETDAEPGENIVETIRRDFDDSGDDDIF